MIIQQQQHLVVLLSLTNSSGIKTVVSTLFRKCQADVNQMHEDEVKLIEAAREFERRARVSSQFGCRRWRGRERSSGRPDGVSSSHLHL